MKWYIYATEQEIGSPLKTLKGSRIARSKYRVGKDIGGSIYVHKEYADEVIPLEDLEYATKVLHDNYPDFDYNCVRWDYKTNKISFQESPDFDTAREPKVGDYVTVDLISGKTKTGHSDYIFHHKWLWVRNDYTGFDVEDSWKWSKEWLSVLTESSDGNGINRWNAQLKRFGLPVE